MLRNNIISVEIKVAFKMAITLHHADALTTRGAAASQQTLREPFWGWCWHLGHGPMCQLWGRLRMRVSGIFSSKWDKETVFALHQDLTGWGVTQTHRGSDAQWLKQMTNVYSWYQKTQLFSHIITSSKAGSSSLGQWFDNVISVILSMQHVDL